MTPETYLRAQPGLMWAAGYDGVIIYSFGKALPDWGIPHDSVQGSRIYDWPDPAPFAYAVSRFQMGEEATVHTVGLGDFPRITSFRPFDLNGATTVLAMGLAVDVPPTVASTAITPRSVIDAHWEEVRGNHGR